MKIFHEAVKTISKHRYAAATTVAVLVCNMLILGISFHVIRNLNKFLNEVNSSVQITAYASEKLKPEDIVQMVAVIKAQNGVSDCHYVSKEEAIKEFAADPDFKNYMENVKENPLPNTVKVEVEKEHRNAKGLQELAAFVGTLPGITEVNYRKDETERFLNIVSSVELFAAGFALILVLSSAFVVTSTVRNNIYSRRGVINSMLKSGSNAVALKKVFVLESVMLGAAGGLIAASLLLLIELAVIGKINLLWSGRWARVDALYFSGIVIFSAALGFLSSAFIRIEQSNS